MQIDKRTKATNDDLFPALFISTAHLKTQLEQNVASQILNKTKLSRFDDRKKTQIRKQTKEAFSTTVSDFSANVGAPESCKLYYQKSDCVMIKIGLAVHGS